MSLENLKAQRQAILQKISKDPKNKRFHQHSLSAVEQQIREFELAAKKSAQSKGGADDNAVEAAIQQAFKDDAYLGELNTALTGAKNRRANWQKKMDGTTNKTAKEHYVNKISEEENEILKQEQEIAKRRDEIIQSVTANLSEEEDVEEVEVEEVAAKTDAQVEGSESKSKEELEELIEQKQAELEELREILKITDKGTEEYANIFNEVKSLKDEIDGYRNELESLSKPPIPLTEGAVKELKIAAKTDSGKTSGEANSQPTLTREHLVAIEGLVKAHESCLEILKKFKESF
jgi:hypothetical protein